MITHLCQFQLFLYLDEFLIKVKQNLSLQVSTGLH